MLIPCNSLHFGQSGTLIRTHLGQQHAKSPKGSFNYKLMQLRTKKNGDLNSYFKLPGSLLNKLVSPGKTSQLCQHLSFNKTHFCEGPLFFNISFTIKIQIFPSLSVFCFAQPHCHLQLRSRWLILGYFTVLK